MKRLVFILALAACLMSSGSALAQYRNDAVLFSINAGGVTASDDDFDESVTGNTADFFLEKVLADGKATVGFSVPYIAADATRNIEGEDPVDLEYSSVPFLLTAKYNILNGRFAGFVGAGIGLHSSSLKTNAGTTEEMSKSTTGMAFSIPVGIAYFLDDDFYLQGSYHFRSLSGAPLGGGITHSLTLGLGFQWGAE
jgi:opacity protein-like surface antigen